MKRSGGKQNPALYKLQGNPGIGAVLPYSVQQVLAMFVTNMVPIGIIGA